VANDFDAFAADLNRVAKGLGGEAAEAVLTRVGVEAKKTYDHSVKAKLGGDQRFSGWKKARVTSGFDFDGPTRIVLAARPNGPAVVANDGRKRGNRKPRRGGRSNVGWGPTPAWRTWDKAIEDIDDDLPKLVEQEGMKELRRMFGG
jgi:hypothetical protein